MRYGPDFKIPMHHFMFSGEPHYIFSPPSNINLITGGKSDEENGDRGGNRGIVV
jgi:hypothetical protein